MPVLDSKAKSRADQVEQREDYTIFQNWKEDVLKSVAYRKAWKKFSCKWRATKAEFTQCNSRRSLVHEEQFLLQSFVFRTQHPCSFSWHRATEN
ncbi:hypothetical protein TNCV_627781 [Trichonephila clavipes]|nr:hypothetical protein TNCV_627781 [Trichonephila clavipes]